MRCSEWPHHAVYNGIALGPRPASASGAPRQPNRLTSQGRYYLAAAVDVQMQLIKLGSSRVLRNTRFSFSASSFALKYLRKRWLPSLSSLPVFCRGDREGEQAVMLSTAC
jgi:hypothetical protein